MHFHRVIFGSSTAVQTMKQRALPTDSSTQSSSVMDTQNSETSMHGKRFVIMLRSANSLSKFQLSPALSVVEDSAALVFILNAKEVEQPGNTGSCLFHSLASGDPSVNPGSGGVTNLETADALREELTQHIKKNPDHEHPGAISFRAAIMYEKGLTPEDYTILMSSRGSHGIGEWGGAVEMAAFRSLKRENVHVYRALLGKKKKKSFMLLALTRFLGKREIQSQGRRQRHTILFGEEPTTIISPRRPTPPPHGHGAAKPPVPASLAPLIEEAHPVVPTLPGGTARTYDVLIVVLC
jgi:hypothetical protein